MRKQGLLFIGSFVAVASVSIVSIAHATIFKTYSATSCQVDNDNQQGYFTNGSMQNRDSTSHHYYCPVIEDSTLDLSGSGISLNVNVYANSYNSTPIEARSCRQPADGNAYTCGAYSSASSGAGNVQLTPNVSTAWEAGSSTEGDNYYVDVILYQEDSSGLYNALYSYTTLN